MSTRRSLAWLQHVDLVASKKRVEKGKNLWNHLPADPRQNDLQFKASRWAGTKMNVEGTDENMR